MPLFNKKFGCMFCKRGFTRSDNLRFHIKNNHNDAIENIAKKQNVSYKTALKNLNNSFVKKDLLKDTINLSLLKNYITKNETNKHAESIVTNSKNSGALYATNASAVRTPTTTVGSLITISTPATTVNTPAKSVSTPVTVANTPTTVVSTPDSTVCNTIAASSSFTDATSLVAQNSINLAINPLSIY